MASNPLHNPKLLETMPLPFKIVTDLLSLVTDLKQVSIQLVLQHPVLIPVRVLIIILPFKFRAAMALVVLQHLQHIQDLTTHHLLARPNLLHQILTMVLPNLTKIIMVLLLAVQLMLLPFQHLTLITHLQLGSLLLLLTHTVLLRQVYPLLRTHITPLLLLSQFLLPPTMVQPKLPQATRLQLEELEPLLSHLPKL